jgi:hypothetical protein
VYHLDAHDDVETSVDAGAVARGSARDAISSAVVREEAVGPRVAA